MENWYNGMYRLFRQCNLRKNLRTEGRDTYWQNSNFIFSNSEKHILHEIMQIIRIQSEFQIRDIVLNDEVLDFGKLVINPLKRNAEKNGQEIKLTLYEFEILYLLLKIPAGYFQKHKFIGIYGKSLIVRHMTVSCISFIICVVKLKMTGDDRPIF